MLLLKQIQSFFALDALDTRIQHKKAINTTSGSKWKLLEFRFYVLVCCVTVPSMFYTTVKATSPSNVNYQNFERLLSPGWIFGRKVDNSDQQYKFFRDNLLLLSVVVIVHIFLKKSIVKFLLAGNRLLFDFVFGLIFLFVLHGVNMLKIVFLIGFIHIVNLICIKKRLFKAGQVIMFVVAIGSLFFNVHFRKWKYEQILFLLKPLDAGFKGIVSRWDVFYNFMLLRVLSYELDFLEANSLEFNKKEEPSAIELIDRSSLKEDASAESLVDEVKSDKVALTDLERLSYKHKLNQFNILNQLAYLLYAPLIIAGPIITFNDFLYQNKKPLKCDMKFKIKYLFRLLFCILVMEVLLHYTYVVALSKFKAWDGLTPYQISMIGLFNLNLIWLKLLIPWRFFRLWSLLDNIDPTENMLRCMNNNFSALKFWRSWHRSFNKWVIRYIYIPLGGGTNRVIASLCVFSFVAIWHDIELKLLIWGWMIVLFLLPEIYLSSLTYKLLHNKPKIYRLVTGAGCVVNIWMMMIANIFGFCLGEDGTKKFLNDLLCTSDGLLFFVTSSLCLFVAVQVMFEIREDEKRQGVDAKC